MTLRFKRSVHLLFVMLMVFALTTPAYAQTGPADNLTGPERQVLEEYAEDTWLSFVAMVFPESGLPADNISADGTRARYTSPTNIGAYLWSTLVARDLQIIKPAEARERIAQTLDTLAKLERHAESGQFYNWYDPATGEVLRIWPASGGPVYPFLSSVDNGWLAAALIMVANAVPQLRDEALAIVEEMDFGFYYDPNARLLRGGYWPEGTPECNIGGFTCHHYGTFNTEPRIASYIGIAMGDIPPEHYFSMWRTFPDTCDWAWHEMQPEGVTRTYLGIDVYEGHYTYQGIDLVPSWGGSMFEALMVPLLVPEEEWGTQSWAINHPLTVAAQMVHGLVEAQYGYWGFSPANNPAGGYREYGVDAIGMNPDGYSSNQDHTLVDYGFGECRPAQPLPGPENYTNGVVTPHASFLALDFAPRAAMLNLQNLREDFDVYGPWGFWDSVNIDTGEVSYYVLALDQGMVMMALGNALRNDKPQNYFAREVEEALRPLMAMEEFTAGVSAPLPELPYDEQWLLPAVGEPAP
jgi:hypothetical protein